MIRNLKIGMAFMALLGLNAVGTSVAQAASSLDIGAAPALLTGTQVTQNKLVIATASGNVTVKCTTATFEATTTATNVTETTVTPGYGGAGGCSLPLSATWNVNGCKYTLTNTTAALTFNVDIVCAGGAKMEIVQGPCVVSIASQNNLEKIVFDNVESFPHHVLATLEVKNIAANGGAGCPANLVGAHTAELTGSITLKAFQDNAGEEGAQVSLTAT